MKTIRSFHLVLCLAIPLSAQQWNGLSFYKYGKDTLVNPLDGINPKAKIMVVNTGLQAVRRIRVEVSSPDIPNPGGGMAIFPNGGFLYLAPGETTFVSCWTRAVYEGGGTTPAGSYFQRRFLFRFRPDIPGDTSSFSFERALVFINLGSPAQLSGPFSGNGLIVLQPKPINPPPINILIGTLHYRMPLQTTRNDSGAQFTFSSLPLRDDWHLIIQASGYDQIVTHLAPKASTNLRIVLMPVETQYSVSYQLLGTVQTMTGFWRGAVSETEKTVALFPGQENWKFHECGQDSSLKTEARIYKYTFGGQKLWEYTPGWETWGGDMSRDGLFVAYALNTGRFGSCYAPLPTVVLLNGATGQKIWEKEGPAFESYEVAFSPGGDCLEIGSTGRGSIVLVERFSGNEVWTIPTPPESFGQVRRIKFDASGEYLYSASGDDYLRKIRTSDGAVVWKAFIWGWGWINGMNFSPDGSLIVVGTKSGDVTMLRISDGSVLWSKETGNFEDVVFSPDGKHVATFTGHVLNARAGELEGENGFMSPPYFVNNDLVCKLPNGVKVFTIGGERIYEFPNPPDIGVRSGEQVQWGYYSAEGHAVVAARDMSDPPQTGIAFYKGSISTSAVDISESEPGQYRLRQNYPNPFNPTTKILFSIPKRRHVILKVYSILGMEVSTLVDGIMDAGEHAVVFSARDGIAKELASGVYFYRIQAGEFVEARKAILIR
jgi:hypothetical protein